jgi:outer membrane protein assembly factor BamD
MEFQFLADHFPKSEHSEESEFMMGKIKFLQTPSPELDQEETFNALKYMRDFIEKYPDSRFKREAEDIVKKCREKLAKKIFNNMVLYLKMGKLSSAQVYFQILKEEYSDLSLYDKAKEIIEDRK